MPSYSIPALVRANELLSYVSSKEPTFVEIVSDLRLPRSSAYSMLKTLEEIGFLRKINDGRYALGFRLLELGALAVAKVDLRKEAESIMQKLVQGTGLTCHLGSLDESGAFYMAKIQAPNSLLVNSWEGKRVSLTTSGIGKALLAFQKPKERQKRLATMETEENGWGKFADKADFIRELDLYAARGWAVDDGEDSPHIRCVAAPVFDAAGTASAAISVTGPKDDLPDERLPVLAGQVIEAARELSQKLGASGAR